MSAPDLYPLSTQNGQAIPYDVVEGLALRQYTFTTAATVNSVIPIDWSLVYLYATSDCILRNDATPLPAADSALEEAVTYDRTIFVPANTMLVAILNPTVISIRALIANGVLYITSIRRWAGLSQTQQSSVQ